MKKIAKGLGTGNRIIRYIAICSLIIVTATILSMCLLLGPSLDLVATCALADLYIFAHWVAFSLVLKKLEKCAIAAAKKKEEKAERSQHTIRWIKADEEQKKDEDSINAEDADKN